MGQSALEHVAALDEAEARILTEAAGRTRNPLRRLWLRARARWLSTRAAVLRRQAGEAAGKQVQPEDADLVARSRALEAEMLRARAQEVRERNPLLSECLSARASQLALLSEQSEGRRRTLHSPEPGASDAS